MNKIYKVYLANYDAAIASMFKSRKDEFELLAQDDHDKADIIVFDGGPDVSPDLYGEKILSRTFPSVAKERHNKFFFDTYKYVFKVGICFG